MEVSIKWVFNFFYGGVRWFYYLLIFLEPERLNLCSMFEENFLIERILKYFEKNPKKEISLFF